jgi:DNA-binding transcriptional ArsR family regulator
VARLFGDQGQNNKPKLSVLEEPSAMPAAAVMVVVGSMMPPVKAIRQVIGVGETTGSMGATAEGPTVCRLAAVDAGPALREAARWRRMVLLRAGERPVTELAQELGMTQPGTSKHLRVLREVGLVRDRKAGKQRLYGLDARELRPVHEWTGGFERFWNESFDRLDAYVQDLKQARQEE